MTTKGRVRQSDDPNLPKLVRVRATRSFDLMDEGQEVTTELDPFIQGRIDIGYLEVVDDGGEDPAPASPDEPPAGPGA